MHSERFHLPVVLTEHAKTRMQERGIAEALVLDIIDTGMQKDAGNNHYWFYKHFDTRDDNLLCVAAVIDNVVVIKTIMHHWEPMP
jgi:hypothetical protein